MARLAGKLEYRNSAGVLIMTLDITSSIPPVFSVQTIGITSVHLAVQPVTIKVFVYLLERQSEEREKQHKRIFHPPSQFPKSLKSQGRARLKAGVLSPTQVPHRRSGAPVIWAPASASLGT